MSRRILYLHSDGFGGSGGIALYNRDALTALADDPAIDEIVAIPRAAPHPTGPVPDKVTHDLAVLRGNAAYLRAVARHAMRGRYDLVYCGHINVLPVAWPVARLLRVPIVLTCYGIDAWQPSPRAAVRYAARRVDRVFPVSRVTQERFRGWSGVTEDRCTWMPNAIHLADYGDGPRDDAFAERLGLSGRRVLLTLGRMAASEGYKGFDKVIEVLPDLARRFPDICYVIAGTGDDRPRYEALAHATGVADRVVFAGFVPEHEKAALNRLADVCVLASWGEGFGYVLLEAMACGTPSIGSIRDGGREAMRDGLLGPLIDPFDRDALTGAIATALDRPRGIPPGLDYYDFPAHADRFRAAIHAEIDAAA